MIGLIASDMDGTLLGARMEISEYNIAAIKKAEEQGITFMVATGRGYNEAKPALDDAGIECGMITVNGAQVFDKAGNILFTIGINKNTAQEIMSIFDNHAIYYEIATTHGVFSNNRAQRLENAAAMLANTIPHLTFKMAISMAAAHLEMLHIIYIEDYASLLKNEDITILKFIAFSEQEQAILGPIAQKIKPIGDLAVTSSHPSNIEVNHSEAQKGIAVKKIASSMNLSLKDVMTIGDNFNDLSMLEEAGVSFAMGNAEEKIKEVAKYETDSHLEDGVGKAILRAINENL